MALKQLKFPVYFPLKVVEGLVDEPFRPDLTETVEEERLQKHLDEINAERFMGKLKAGLIIERRKKFWVGKTKYAGFAQFNHVTGQIEVAAYAALRAFPDNVRKAAIYLAALHAYAYETNGGKHWPLNKGTAGARFVEWVNEEMFKFPGHRAYKKMQRKFYQWAAENMSPRP